MRAVRDRQGDEWGNVYCLRSKAAFGRTGKGDIVICDNLSVHKNATAGKLIEAHGCELVYLPAYSPDLNPIEQAFATPKNDVCKASPREHAGLL